MMQRQAVYDLAPIRSYMKTFDASGTAGLLLYADLIQHIEAASLQYERGEITSPARLVLPLSEDGVLLSMPATAPDIGTHKLVTVQPRNKSISLPTIHGLITVCDGTTGIPVCQLDGQVDTGRRTVAVSLLAIRKLPAKPPQKIFLIGTGAQAAYHVEAILDVYPDCECPTLLTTVFRARTKVSKPRRPRWALSSTKISPMRASAAEFLLLNAPASPSYWPTQEGRHLARVRS
jgi:1-piperideine-2-carboxylate/1-pyrroline-2-carboxylate reductase [NAD(P)H]